MPCPRFIFDMNAGKLIVNPAYAQKEARYRQKFNVERSLARSLMTPDEKRKSRGEKPRSQMTPEEKRKSRGKRPPLGILERLMNAEVIGIDGEGFTNELGQHLYVYMAAWQRDECLGDITNMQGLRPTEIFDFLLSLSSKPYKMGFSLGYDYTKMFEFLPSDVVYDLCHPEVRRSKVIGRPPAPRIWEGYKLNLLRGQFSVARLKPGEHTDTCGRITFGESSSIARKYAPHSHRVDCRKEKCPGCRYECPIHMHQDVKKCDECALTECPGCVSYGSPCVVWDIWQFFQQSFVEACKAWNGDASIGQQTELVITKAKLEEMKQMKDARSTFKYADFMSGKVQKYCGDECSAMSRLGSEMLKAHGEAGIPLKKFYGAGSTGEALMGLMNAHSFMKEPGKEKEPMNYGSEALIEAIMCAFFGGRFECSIVGLVPSSTYNNDISAAYPYEFTFLPCLVHGKWRRITNRASIQKEIEQSTTAIVRYSLPFSDMVHVDKTRRYMIKGELHQLLLFDEGVGDGWASPIPWGPFPLRHETTGNIFFPVTSGGGWVWKKEFLAGQRFAPNVKIHEAWVYNADCACKVFTEEMPKRYRQRCEWGKEGRGKVMKLGANSCPGKTAQSIGAAPYQNFVWAGMVNAGTRAELLNLMMRATSPANVLMCATDGAVATERINHPLPRDTGTYDLKKPLGGWEVEEYPFGFLLVRPGVYMNVIDKERENKIRARGMSRKNMLDKRAQVMADWKKDGLKASTIVERNIFNAMKMCIRRDKKTGRAKRDAKYGTWCTQKLVLNYDPTPKRPCVLGDSLERRDNYPLASWAFEDSIVSAPYEPKGGKIPDHVRERREAEEIAEGQPDREDVDDGRFEDD
jgi:hypothetical protein